MEKLLIIFGTRPEAIKLAPIISLLRTEKFRNKLDFKVCVTGQHRELLDQVLDIFEIKPDFDLDLMTKQQDLSNLSSRMLEKLAAVLEEYHPEKVLVHGDTTTSFIASLASFYADCEVVHVEAGLRTNDLTSPWPEEANRQLTARLAKVHMAPTERAKSNLINEGIREERIFVTGNTVIDAMMQTNEKILLDEELKTSLIADLSLDFDLQKEKFILLTGHRRENIGQNFLNVCNAIKSIAKEFSNIHVVFAMHMNPMVVNSIKANLNEIQNVHLIPPQNYLAFILLISHCYLVLTDSGGIQEEAPTFGKPVLVIRNTTERPEIIQSGVGLLVGTDYEKIYESIKLVLGDEKIYDQMANAGNPFGDGTASRQILENLYEK